MWCSRTMESRSRTWVIHRSNPGDQSRTTTGVHEAGVMGDALHRWFGDAFAAQADPLPGEPQFHHLVAGLVALADWIASDRQFFPFSAPFDFRYDTTAHERARRRACRHRLRLVRITGPAGTGLLAD